MKIAIPLLTAVTLTLSACGGGSGGRPNAATDPSANTQTDNGSTDTGGGDLQSCSRVDLPVVLELDISNSGDSCVISGTPVSL